MLGKEFIGMCVCVCLSLFLELNGLAGLGIHICIPQGCPVGYRCAPLVNSSQHHCVLKSSCTNIPASFFKFVFDLRVHNPCSDIAKIQTLVPRLRDVLFLRGEDEETGFGGVAVVS